MTYFVTILRASITDFGKNKGRTFLTSLGIMIGVLSVVLLMAAGSGLTKFIKNQFESLGTNLVFVMPGGLLNSRGGFNNTAALGPIFKEIDVSRIRRIDGATVVAPVYTRSIAAVYDGNTEQGTLVATSEEAFEARNLKAEYGSLFTISDVSGRNKVVVIGPKIAENLFDDKKLAVGKKIRLGGTSYRVLGVLESKGGGGFGGPDIDSFIYMPYKTAYSLNTDKKFLQIMVKAKSDQDVPKLKSDLEELLLKYYKEDEFSVIESTEILNAIGSIFGTLNVVLVAIAAISLIVGGIGILNIMYVTVTERIKEIGIRRALGARSGDILWQFMIEAVVLSVFGGVLGIALAAVLVWAVQSYFPAYISWQSIGLAFGTSSAIGIIFGVFPAKKAADLSPIEAIRYE